MTSTVLAQTQAPPIPSNPPLPKPTFSNVIEIPLEALSPSKTNPRKHYDQEALNGLAASIREQGVLQAIVARPATGGLYEIVAGERRWRAAKLAGLKTIPAGVKVLSDIEVAEIQLTENEQRVDVQPLEQGHAYRNLVELLASKDPKRSRQGLIDEVAKKVGLSSRHVYARMKLTELIPELQKDLAAGWISSSHADELVRLCPKDQKEFAAAHLYHYANEEFTRADDGPKFANSVRHVKDKIAKEYQLDLTKPPFPAEDASLVPAAGPCSVCFNNSINSPLMEGAARNKATCMDRACFAKKREAFVAIEATKQKTAAAKTDILRVTPSHELPYSRRDEKDKPKTRKEWKTAHKGECAFVQPAVVVDTSGLHDQAISAKLVCGNTKCEVHFGEKPSRPAPSISYSSSKSKTVLSDAERKQIEQEKKLESKASMAGDVALVKAVLAQVKILGPVELGLFIESVASYSEVEDSGLALIAEMFGWKLTKGITHRQISEWWETHGGKMSLVDMGRFAVGAIICESLGNGYGNFGPKQLDRFAAQYKLDAKAIRKTAADAVLKPAVQTSAVRPPKAGTCRFCQCVEAHACVLQHGKGKTPVTCKWADKSKTLCTNPDCLKQAAKDAKAVTPKKAGAPAKKAAKKGGRK
jgi:ParB/RepB/Spo0J family partition protein